MPSAHQNNYSSDPISESDDDSVDSDCTVAEEPMLNDYIVVSSNNRLEGERRQSTSSPS